MSYRRSDAAGHARALHRELSRRFDAGFAFLDRSGIDVGDEFPERLRAAVESCLVMLVVVGPGWLEAEAADGARRLDDPADFVRYEVSLALATGKVVIPVLLDDAPMPPAGRLPDALQALARCDAVVLRGKDYEYERQLEDLVKQLARRTGVAPQRDNVGLAIDVGDAVAVYRHIEYLPVRLRAPLREAFRPLIEDRQRFFGGRREVIDRLMAFVGGADPGYCVVGAPAGFGKTALAANLVASAGGAIAYHFFTPLYGEETLSETFFLRSVLEQMAAWHDEAWDVPSALDGLRAAYQEAIGKPLAGRGVLLLDGIDEVRGWSLSPYVSRALPSGVHVIATVRDVGQDWRAQFGFPASQLTHVTLDGLDRGGVGAVLATVEGPGAAPVRDGRVRDAVFGLAGGDERQSRLADPFYVRFLAEDLAAGHLTAKTLATAPRGLQAYLDQWWGEIRALAGEQPVRDLFGTLAVAAGPLRREELEALQPSLVDEWHADRFDEVVGRVRRFVVRDPAGGYSLVHPRLREFVQGRIRVEPYRARLLAYCRDWRSGDRYALAYVGLHLAEAGDWPALLGLVATEAGGRAFLDLRRDTERSHAGFLRDLERAWSHSEELAATDPRSLGDVVRCALVASSIRTMAGRLVPSLLEAAVRHDIWPILAAIEYASENPDPVQRSQALATLLPRMSEAQRRRACEAALAAAKAMRPDVRPPPVLVLQGPAPPIRDLDRRGDVLAPLATAVPDELRDDALAIVRSLDRPDQIPVLIVALATGMPPPGHAVLVEEALAAVDRIRPRSLIYSPFMVPPGVRQARALVAMSAYLEEPRRGDVCRMAVDRAGHAPHDRGVRALVELLPKLPPAVAAEAIERIFARLDEGGASRLEQLSAIVAHPAAATRRDALVAEIRSRLQEEDDAEAVAEGLLGICPFLPEGERAASRDLLLQRAASIEDADARGRILARVAEQSEPGWRQRALDAAVEAIAQMDDEEAWVEAVVRLVPMGDDALHRQILGAAASVEDAEERARVLDAIAACAGREVIVEALAHGRIIGDDLQGDALPEGNASDVRWKEDVDASEAEDGMSGFYAVARPGTLAEARAISFDLERVAGLALVARSRPDVERVGVLDEAFAEAVRINDCERRHRALCIVGRALAGASWERLSALCVHALRTGAARPRAELASDLAALRPLVEQVDRGAAAALGAIVDEIVQWLP